MFRLSSLCPFCEATSLSKSISSSWHTRGAATLQQRRPSRMVLSERVARGPPKTTENGKTAKKPKSRNSPWAGTNLTEPPRERYGTKRMVSPAEQKRANRHAKEAKGTKQKDPMKALKMQRALASVSYEKRAKVKQELLDRNTFEEFDLLPSIKESACLQALGGLVGVSPTPIQRLTIPALLGMETGRRRSRRRSAEDATKKEEMQQFLLAAETGSGKTLAYVLPIVDAIKRAEKVEAEQERISKAQKEKEKANDALSSVFELEAPKVEQSNPAMGRPRAIILVPTSELVVQVGTVIKSLAHTVKFRSAMISASFTSTVIRNRLFSPNGIDIVVSTPHLLNSIAETDPNILSRVSHLVIDEADSLLDRSFSPITSSIVDRATPSLEQLIMCSATIPRSLDSYLQKRYPDTRRLVTPNLHAIPRRVQLSVVDVDKVPYQGNRDLACAQTIWDIGKEVSDAGEEREKKIVVFVNEREKTIELAEYLRNKGIEATALSRDSDERKQAEVLAAFTGAAIPAPKPKPDEQPRRRSKEPTSKRTLPNIHVLVMTDLGSRGIDTLLVKHVILYDVPHTSIDFIHRLGRVGRMGRRGRGVVLVGKNDRKDVVREVREGMFKGQALI
ncbi:ATP-dependent RNA helicase mrh4, mitochondrial [Acrodontium crateriforme]|uniref:RNA helicase n=1 Tax=Acrodontium crateriforme TaxID=150365 RepID=A0AAQ3M8S3_9PEZI|nr:ATP-dependent RNA helicase mrh4, mitochondrial [Acrodontium crateriforme]